MRTQHNGTQVMVLSQLLEGQETAEVEFVARVRVSGKATRLHERSRFVCEQGQWLYVSAVNI